MSETFGVDTNVLLRGLLADDGAQLARAERLLDVEDASRVVVNVVVLAELYWNLRAVEKAPKPRIVAALDGLLATEGFVFPDRDCVIAALDDYRAGLGDFTDRLIARLNEAEGASRTYTFDRTAARHLPLAPVP